MKEYQELDAIEKEPESECPGYDMPHHAVVREAASTTKLRVVFNASASQKGDFSLNDVIEPGPSLLPNLAGLLDTITRVPMCSASRHLVRPAP